MSRALAGFGAGVGTVLGGFAAGFVVNNVVRMRQKHADTVVLVSLIGGGVAGAMIGAGRSCDVPTGTLSGPDDAYVPRFP